MQIKTFVVGSLQTNCYIIHDENKAVMIDPGANGDRLLEYLNQNKLRLDYIFLTHGHFDHMLEANYIKEATKAKIVIHKYDAGAINDEKMSAYMAFARKPFEKTQADILVSDGDCIEFLNQNISFIHTPGHTKGSVVIKLLGVLFTGDTLFEGDCGRWDLPGGSMSEILDSLKKLYNLEGDFIVYPGHGSKTTLEKERQNNKSMLLSLKV